MTEQTVTSQHGGTQLHHSMIKHHSLVEHLKTEAFMVNTDHSILIRKDQPS